MLIHIEGQLGFILEEKTLHVRLLCGVNGGLVKPTIDNSTARARAWREKNRDLYNRRRRERAALLRSAREDTLAIEPA
jgi:hypothetical protein